MLSNHMANVESKLLSEYRLNNSSTCFIIHPGIILQSEQ